MREKKTSRSNENYEINLIDMPLFSLHFLNNSKKLIRVCFKNKNRGKNGNSINYFFVYPPLLLRNQKIDVNNSTVNSADSQTITPNTLQNRSWYNHDEMLQRTWEGGQQKTHAYILKVYLLKSLKNKTIPPLFYIVFETFHNKTIVKNFTNRKKDGGKRKKGENENLQFLTKISQDAQKKEQQNLFNGYCPRLL